MQQYNQYRAMTAEIYLLTESVRKFKNLNAFPSQYEKHYQQEFLASNESHARLTLLLGVILFSGSTIFDLTFLTQTYSLLVRFFIVTPILFLFYVASFSKDFVKQQEVFVALFAIVAVIGLVAIAAVIPPTMRSLLYSSLVLIAFFVTTIAKLSFRYTCYVMVAVLLVFNIGYQFNESSSPELFFYWDWLGNNYILIGAFILCAIASYFNELNYRKQFLLHQLINKKNQLSTYLSNYDAVTGIPNRRYFDKLIEQHWESALKRQETISVLFIDFDFFKEYNEQYGHLSGDQALHLVANSLAQFLEPYRGLICRYGGDEFIIILENTPLPKVIKIAQELMDKVQALDLLHGGSGVAKNVTVTVGICSLLPKSELAYRDLIENADLALRYGKKQGRNCIYVYADGQIMDSKSQMKMI